MLFQDVLDIYANQSFQMGEEGLTKLTLHICEEGLRLTEEASHRLNRYVHAPTFISNYFTIGV